MRITLTSFLIFVGCQPSLLGGLSDGGSPPLGDGSTTLGEGNGSATSGGGAATQGDPSADDDGDGLTNGEEASLGSDPNNSDSDGDGYGDGEEVEGNTDPLSAWDHPYQGGWSIADCRYDVLVTGNGVGQSTSNFALTDQFGDTLQLHDFCDRAVILVGSATWCGPCRDEASVLASLYNNFEEQGLMVITLLGENSAHETPDQSDLREWAEAYNLDHPVVADPGFRTSDRFIDGAYIYLPSTTLLGSDAEVLLRDSAISTSTLQSALNSL
jgi:peroxiredoxin